MRTIIPGIILPRSFTRMERLLRSLYYVGKTELLVWLRCHNVVSCGRLATIGSWSTWRLGTVMCLEEDQRVVQPKTPSYSSSGNTGINRHRPAVCRHQPPETWALTHLTRGPSPARTPVPTADHFRAVLFTSCSHSSSLF